MAHWAMLSLAVEFSVFQTHLGRLETRQTIFGVPCSSTFFYSLVRSTLLRAIATMCEGVKRILKSCCLVNSSVLRLMNMFGIGQCKTRTTDYCFSTCKWERNNNSPTVSHLKNNGSQSLRSLHFKVPRLVFYACVYAFITPGDAQIKFEASFLQKQNQRRLTDFTKGHLLFRFLETSRLAMVNGNLH